MYNCTVKNEVVVDTSVLIAVLVDAPDRPALIASTAGTGLVAPLSVHWEIGNAFSAMLKRKRISLGDATAAIETYESIPIRFVDVDLAEALTTAARSGLYAYDAYLIVAAREQNMPLVTLDRGLADAARRLGVELLEVKE